MPLGTMSITEQNQESKKHRESDWGLLCLPGNLLFKTSLSYTKDKAWEAKETTQGLGVSGDLVTTQESWSALLWKSKQCW